MQKSVFTQENTHNFYVRKVEIGELGDKSKSC